MRREQGDRIDPSKPALIVRCGSTRRKCRPLVNEVVLLGRAPGCDIGLVSPEVAPVHCVIVRLSDGWRIRDCSGRGTQVNGKSASDQPLRDGDIIQVGTFSFEAHLPGVGPAEVGHTPREPAAEAAAPADVEKLRRSRRRWAEMALGLRRRLREQDGERTDLSKQQADLEQMERRLRNVHQEQMARQAKVAEQAQQLEPRARELDAYARSLRRQAEQLHNEQQAQVRHAEMDRVGFEADLLKEQVELREERQRLVDWQSDLQSRQDAMEATAGQLEQVLAVEREQIDRDRDQVAREREYLDQQRRDLLRERAELERLREGGEGAVTPAPAGGRDTHLDASPADRLESARKLLRELSERRKSLSGTAVAPPPVSSTGDTIHDTPR